MGTLLQIAGCIPTFSTRGKGALGPLSSAPAGASERETPTSNLTESIAWGGGGGGVKSVYETSCLSGRSFL